MIIEKLTFDKIPQFSARDIAYTNGDERFRPFYKYDVDIASFPQIFTDKEKEIIDRDTLVKVLQKQYSAIQSPSAAALKNVDLLASSNTFTVITAHQPSLFTGPLYYIYKIISTINLAKTLNEAYPSYKVVPVFVTGGEDHDFEEVQKTYIFNKPLIWENEESGSVGSMQTDSLGEVLNALKEILGNSENANNIFQIIEEAYTENDTYAKATIQLVDRLFGKDGLVVVNMNNADFKRLFIPIIKDELLEQTSYKLVSASSKAINEAGFKTQAAPREINLFYLRDQIRERIVLEGDRYVVLNTAYSFSKAEMLQEVENHPENFSPNVILRPLYQEKILPNLAYIGGGGELAYWLERKTQFEHYAINFPMLIRRNSALWIDKGNTKRIRKLGLNTLELFARPDDLIKVFIDKVSETPLNIGAQKKELARIFEEIATIAEEVDPTLKAKVLAEGSKQEKVLGQLEGRLVRAEKQKHDTAIQQIRSLKEKLFFNDGLQERRDNFMNLYLQYGDSMFDILKANLHPLDKRFVILTDAE